MLLRVCLVLCGLVLPDLVLPAFALARPATSCDQAAAQAARESGVPLEVLLALTRAETGRAGAQGLVPWPWAVNQAGQGYWFDTQAEAEQFVEAQLAFGYSNLDLGCFQLNHRWHGAAFSSLRAMFDPLENARYAAAFLAEKHRQTGDWLTAAGAYHSGTEEYAERYIARFSEILSGLSGMQVADLTGGAEALPRVNSFPLLQGGATGTGASLVPQVAGVGSLFLQVP